MQIFLDIVNGVVLLRRETPEAEPIAIRNPKHLVSLIQDRDDVFGHWSLEFPEEFWKYPLSREIIQSMR